MPELGQRSGEDPEGADSTVTLDLSLRRLTDLPPEVLRLSGLQVINLYGNKITTLPPETVRLSCLRSVNLAGNLLPTVPCEITELPQLRLLDLYGNRLIAVPPEIGNLNRLRGLNLGGNPLLSLPPELGRLVNLQRLDLAGATLSGLPAQIGNLSNLESLVLDGNDLAGLPAQIGLLTNLRKLSIRGNQLTVLPPEIGKLTSLQELDLSGNRLTSLPPEIGQLTNLRELNLDANEIVGLPPEIGNLDNLELFNLSGNRLARLPAEVGGTIRLRELNLDGNQLTDLPPEIGRLAHLQLLSLDDNLLIGLRRELAPLLRKGLTISVAANPLIDPLPEFLGRGSDALATYLSSLEDAVAHYEAKVLLVGEGSVGKTSLVASLTGAPFVADRPTTHGIEIHPVVLRHPDKPVDMTVRIWDFGGQEVYRITHQFFFSRRSLYVMVWNAREGQERNEVDGWLRRIRLRVGASAWVIIVATHADERRPELDYPYLHRTLPGMLVGQYAVDNRSASGVPELHTAIAAQAARLPQMGQLLNPRWIAARDEILALAEAEPQIPFGDFAAVCERHGVTDDEIPTLLNLLHDLGQVIYYGDDESLQDVVVLKPEWLTKAIDYVLEDTATREAKGVLSHARLREIWQERPDGPGYPARYHPYFLRLMEKFDVSYRLADDEHSSLVAQLVPHEQPDLPWVPETEPPSGTRTLSLVCKLSEPAPGLIAWLTVRHHAASTGKHWRHGVFLRHPNSTYASEALIQVRPDGHLVVDVRAPSPDMYFNVLRDSVENLITSRWLGLSFELLVPCPARKGDGARCDGAFPLIGLVRYRENGGLTQNCLHCQATHDVSQLLTGFAGVRSALEPELERLHQEIGYVARNVRQVRQGVQRVESGVRDIAQVATDTAGSVRRVIKAISAEAHDCPRLFTLAPRGTSLLRRMKFYEDHYTLTLWCEEPGLEHPWRPGTYRLRRSRDWLIKVAPYANLILKTLRLILPISGAVAGVEMSSNDRDKLAADLDLMNTLIEKLPDEVDIEQLAIATRPGRSLLDATEGQALRTFRATLFQADPNRAFGDLRRVLAPSGEFLWVCRHHYQKYDPGLPKLDG